MQAADVELDALICSAKGRIIAVNYGKAREVRTSGTSVSFGPP